MRYEFEVGDYVKIIANKSTSSHSIGYIGKVTQVQDFPRAEMPGIWYNIDNGKTTWSHYSEVVPATKEAYEAQNKPKPKFKVGDWIKIINSGGGTHPDDVGMISKIVSTTAIGIYPEYTIEIADMKKGNYDKFLDPKVIRLATKAEVKQHLLAEASRRGFKIGVSYKTSDTGRNTAYTNPELYANMNSRFNLHCGYGCGLIYNDFTSEWATIVPDEKKLCGHMVKKGEYYTSIGCKDIRNQDLDGFITTCDFFNVTDIWATIGTTRYQTTFKDIKEALK